MNRHSPSPESTGDRFPYSVERARKLVHHYKIPEAEREEIIQTALMAMLAHGTQIKDPEAWLLGTVKNKCILYWRKRRNSLAHAVDTAIIELITEDGQLSKDLEIVLESLPPRCRSLLRLRYGLGYSESDAAETLGYHASSIRKVTTRCLATLTRELIARGFASEKPPAEE